MAQTQTWETKTNWAMEKWIPKELAKNNKQTINNPRMENKSEDTPRTKISRFKQSFKASQRILKSKPIMEKVESNHQISKTYTTRQIAIETILISKMEPILQTKEKVWRHPKKKNWNTMFQIIIPKASAKQWGRRWKQTTKFGGIYSTKKQDKPN